jgi:hypothetical protein
MWKIRVFEILGVIALGEFMYALTRSKDGPKQSAIAFVAFVATAFVAMAWLCVSVHCRRCGWLPVVHLARTRDVGALWTDLMNLRSCAVCGDDTGRKPSLQLGGLR